MTWSLLPALLACVRFHEHEPDHDLDALHHTDGDVRGYVDLGGSQPIWFASGVAYRAEDGRETIRLTSWPNVSCDDSRHKDWTNVQNGWYLEFEHDGIRAEAGGHAVMKCEVERDEFGAVGRSECGARGKERRVDVDLDLFDARPARGGMVWGRARLTQEGRPLGDVRFQLTHCGEERVGHHGVRVEGSLGDWAANAPPPAWNHLWPALESCGQLPDDSLYVAVRGGLEGHRPWPVEVLQATSGAEACVRDVLKNAPLDARFDPRRLVMIDQLKTRYLHHAEVLPGRPTARCQVPGGDPDPVTLEPLEAIVCPSDVVLTVLTLTYEKGDLVHSSTDPAVSCVEEQIGASQNLTDVPHEWGDTFDSLTCTFDLPLPPTPDADGSH